MPGVADFFYQWGIEHAQADLSSAQAQHLDAVRAVGGFVVDPGRARACVDELSRIVEDVRLGLLDIRQLRFGAPGYDEVSVNVSRNGAVMAFRAQAYVMAWAGQIEATRDALQRQLDAYLDGDRANADGRA